MDKSMYKNYMKKQNNEKGSLKYNIHSMFINYKGSIFEVNSPLILKTFTNSKKSSQTKLIY